MALALRAGLVSVLVHGLLVAVLAFLPTGARQDDGLPPGDFTLVWLSDAPTGAEPSEVVVPVSVEPPQPSPLPGPDQGPSAPPAAPLSNPGGQGGATPGTAGPRRTPSLAVGSARSVVFLIDRSISMGLSGSLGPSKDELAALLEALPATSHFQVVAYNLKAEPLLSGPGLVPAEPDAVRFAVSRVADLRPSGGTDHLAALKRGLLLRPDAVVLVTDGLELPDGALAEVTLLNRGRSAIHVLEVARSRQRDGVTPARLSERNRGSYRRVLAP